MTATGSRHAIDRPPVEGAQDVVGAWWRAGLYIAALLAVSAVAGTVTAVWSEPWGTLSGPGGWGSVLIYALVVVVGYGVIWPRGTWTYGRELVLPDAVVLGVLWGLAEGLLFVTVWRAASAVLPAAAAWAVCFVVLSAYVGLVHALWWDRGVAPPHNDPAWNLRKVLLAHVPNLAVGLAVVAWWDAVAVLVGAQVLALTLSTLAMRFPSPRRPAPDRRRLN